MMDKNASTFKIKKITEADLPECLSVIHEAFSDVALQYGITRENCPKHTAFLPIEYLDAHMRLGWYMFGLFEGEDQVGYASLSDEGDGVYELHNIAVLSKCRHKGYGRALINHAKIKLSEFGGRKITIGIIEENTVLKEWYAQNGFIHTGTKKFEHLPFIVGFMEFTPQQEGNINI